MFTHATPNVRHALLAGQHSPETQQLIQKHGRGVLMIRAFGKMMSDVTAHLTSGQANPMKKLWEDLSTRVSERHPNIPKSPPEPLQIKTCEVILDRLVRGSAQHAGQARYASLVRIIHVGVCMTSSTPL